MSDLVGAVALVTGGSSGIGAATVLALHQAGCRVLAVGRCEDRLAGLPAGVRPMVQDLLADDGPATLAARAVKPYGRVDVVVHAAGIGGVRPLTGSSDDELRRVVQLDLLVPLQLTARLLPAMLDRGRGHVVTISSIARLGVPGESAYSAAKGGLAAFTDALRLEVAGSGVGVSEVVPGTVRTPMLAARTPPYSRRIPRPVSAERVATAVVGAVTGDRDVVHVPRWLDVASRVHGAAPRTYARLAGRLG